MYNHDECSISTKLNNENIICSVAKLDLQIAIELEEPWASIPMKSIHFPKDLQNFLPLLSKKKVEFGVNYFSKNKFSIADHTKILLFTRNGNEFDPFNKIEISLPNYELSHLSSYVLYYLSGNTEVFSKWEQKNSKEMNDIFVCIHGERDQCCGKYGLNIFNEFSKQIELNNFNYRVWKSTHIGGHRYAPTFYEAPSMRWYGLFSAEDISSYLNRNSDNFKIQNNYRGMSGLQNKYAALVENELFKKYSWKWLNASEKKYEIISVGENELTEVHFFFKLDKNTDLSKTSYQIQLLNIVEGKASCSSNEIKPVKQYSIKEL